MSISINDHVNRIRFTKDKLFVIEPLKSPTVKKSKKKTVVVDQVGVEEEDLRKQLRELREEHDELRELHEEFQNKNE